MSGSVDLERRRPRRLAWLHTGERRAIHDHQEHGPIVGAFGGFREGSTVTINNTSFTISYHGGDGDDVVLTQGTAVAAGPTVTGISPNSGPTAGGTVVTITGTGFTGATGVDFGTTAATNVTVVNDTTVTADSPAGTGGVDVTVSTPNGASATSTADKFTYTVTVIAPTVTGVSPNSGPAAGGTLVTITGTGFTGATVVDFGTTAATDVTVQSTTTITADQPGGHRTRQCDRDDAERIVGHFDGRSIHVCCNRASGRLDAAIRFPHATDGRGADLQLGA